MGLKVLIIFLTVLLTLSLTISFLIIFPLIYEMTLVEPLGCSLPYTSYAVESPMYMLDSHIADRLQKFALKCLP